MCVAGNVRVSQDSFSFEQENGVAGLRFHRTEFVVYIFGHNLFHKNLQSVHVHEGHCDGIGEYCAVAPTRSLSIFPSECTETQ